MTIDDFNEIIGARLSAGDVHTLAGLVFTTLGRKPAPGEHVEIDGAKLTSKRWTALAFRPSRCRCLDRRRQTDQPNLTEAGLQRIAWLALVSQI